LTRPINYNEEALALLNYFQQRRLPGQIACAVMGVTMTAYLTTPGAARDFVYGLSEQTARHLAKKPVRRVRAKKA